MTVILKTVYRNNTYHKLSVPEKKLYGPGHNLLQVEGKFKSVMEYNDSKINETIYVVKNLEMPLLGRDAITKLNIIKSVFNVESNKNPLTLEKKLKDEYRELFTGLGEL